MDSATETEREINKVDSAFVELHCKKTETNNDNILVRCCRKKYTCVILALICLLNITLIVYQLINTPSAQSIMNSLAQMFELKLNSTKN